MSESTFPLDANLKDIMSAGEDGINTGTVEEELQKNPRIIPSANDSTVTRSTSCATATSDGDAHDSTKSDTHAHISATGEIMANENETDATLNQQIADNHGDIKKSQQEITKEESPESVSSLLDAAVQLEEQIELQDSKILQSTQAKRDNQIAVPVAMPMALADTPAVATHKVSDNIITDTDDSKQQLMKPSSLHDKYLSAPCIEPDDDEKIAAQMVEVSDNITTDTDSKQQLMKSSSLYDKSLPAPCIEPDDDERIAAQMAAVAIAANTTSESPAAAARYARNISATIVALPPHLLDNSNDKKKKTNKLVEKTLVLQFLEDNRTHDHDPSTQDEQDTPVFASAMLQQLTTGDNIHLLNHLLLIHHYHLIETRRTSNNSHSPQTQEYTNLQQQSALKAAKLVSQTIAQIEKSYTHLIDCICVPALNDDLSIGSINTDGLQDYDPNSNFSALSFDSCQNVIPDLLPPCTSTEGDATNAFFQACAAVKVINEEGQDAIKDHVSLISDADGDHVNNSSINNSSDKKVSGPEKGMTSNANSKAVIQANAEKNEQQMARTETSVLSQSSTRTLASTIIGSVFSSVNRRRNRRRSDNGSVTTTSTAASVSTDLARNNEQSIDNSSNTLHQERHVRIGEDYNVTIAREMLGLTVENVLERTVVRTVLPNGAAKRAGTKVGSLVVKVGSVETANLTHFETIDELRQSQRPLKLVLRRIGKDALRGAREEMGRLIKGGGFGTMPPKVPRDSESANDVTGIGSSFDGTEEHSQYIDEYLKVLNKQWMEATKRKLQTTSAVTTKKDEALAKVGAKLAWILSLLVAGFEREVAKDKSGLDDEEISFSTNHSMKSFADAGRSVSKILHDYMLKHFDKGIKPGINSNDGVNNMNLKRKKQTAPPPHIQDKQRQAVPGASKRSMQKAGRDSPQSHSHAEDALLLVGDVLHRAQSFLADPNSPPAALLRGELIALLCDILDMDNGMILSEEESTSSSTDNNAGSINDLGSAGSLLKLIVLNCSMMKSPGCHGTQSHTSHAGNRFLAVVHRLAASRSTSARVTACSLGPVLWSHLDFPHQLQLRGVITRALHDVEVIVRKSTATVLHEIAELVFDPRAVPWLVLMCERAMTDPEPQLRAAAMTLTYHLAEHLPNAILGDASEGSRSIREMPARSDPKFAEVYLLQCKLLPVATRLAEDNTSSVRLAVAAQCDRLAGALGEHWHSVLIDLLQALLCDKDDRVRGEATLCIPRLIESVLSGVKNNGDKNIFILESLLPVALKLQKDPVADVRMCLAAASGELLSFLVWLHTSEESVTNKESTQKHYIDDILIPLLQALLQDTDPEVTSAALRAVTNASRGHARDMATRRNEDDSISLSSQSHAVDRVDPVFRPVLSEAQVLRLVPTLSDLSSSTQWRVRQSAVEIVPALLGCTHNTETRSEIAQLCVKLMSDSVDAVRNSAAECLCLGGSNLGTDESAEANEWLSVVVIPHLEACRDSSNSKQRLLSLKMAEMILADIGRWNTSMIEEIDSESGKLGTISLTRRTLEVASELSLDKIVNVRLNVGRMYGNVLNYLSSDDDLDFVISTLESQLKAEKSKDNGGDCDVVYFAKKAIAQAKERMNRLDEISSLR